MKPFTSEFPPDPLWPKDMVKLRRLLSNHTQWGWKVLEVREVKKKGPLGAPLFRAVLLSPLGVPRAFEFHLYQSGVLSIDDEVPLSPEEQLAYLGAVPIRLNPRRKKVRDMESGILAWKRSKYRHHDKSIWRAYAHEVDGSYVIGDFIDELGISVTLHIRSREQTEPVTTICVGWAPDEAAARIMAEKDFMTRYPDLALARLARRTTRSNPRVAGVELYDPKMEQLRAQRQAVYESQILKALGKKGPFRDPRTGLRADIVLPMGEIGPAVSQFMFAMGTSIQQRDKRLKEGSQTPTSKAVMESMRRYADPDHLIRNRQDYEETLGLARASGFYRVTQEYAAWTPTGYAYFIWPLAPGVLLPQFSLSLEKAREKAAVLNATADPRRTGVWWKSPTKRYTMDDLCYWIPGPAAFGVQAPEQKTRRKAG